MATTRHDAQSAFTGFSVALDASDAGAPLSSEPTHVHDDGTDGVEGLHPFLAISKCAQEGLPPEQLVKMIVEGATAGLSPENLTAILTTAAQHRALQRGAESMNASNDGTSLLNESAESPLPSTLSPSRTQPESAGTYSTFSDSAEAGSSGSNVSLNGDAGIREVVLTTRSNESVVIRFHSRENFKLLEKYPVHLAVTSSASTVSDLQPFVCPLYVDPCDLVTLERLQKFVLEAARDAGRYLQRIDLGFVMNPSELDSLECSDELLLAVSNGAGRSGGSASSAGRGLQPFEIRFFMNSYYPDRLELFLECFQAAASGAGSSDGSVSSGNDDASAFNNSLIRFFQENGTIHASPGGPSRFATVSRVSRRDPSARPIQHHEDGPPPFGQRGRGIGNQSLASRSAGSNTIWVNERRERMERGNDDSTYTPSADGSSYAEVLFQRAYIYSNLYMYNHLFYSVTWTYYDYHSQCEM